MTTRARYRGLIPPAMRFRGRMSIFYNTRHGWVARKWQKPGRPNPSARELIGRELFKQATQFVREADPQLIEAAKQAAGPTAWTWKDYLISNMYGRGTVINLPDGTTLKGWRTMADEAQELLDSITQSVGAILVRTSTGWQGMTPGSIGTVITSEGPASPPDYEPVPGGGGGTTSADLWGPPAASQFSTVINGGSASPAPSIADDADAGVIADSGPVTASSDQVRALLTAVPGATPWSLTARLRLTAYPAGNRKGGLYISDGTKLMCVERSMTASDAVRVSKYTNSTTFSTSSSFVVPSAWEYYRIRNDGTKLYFDMGRDGKSYTQLFNENVGTFLTPTLIGLGFDANTGGTASNLSSEHLELACAYWQVG